MGGKIAVSPSVVTRTIDNTQNIARLSNAISYVVNGNKSIESGTIPVGSYVRLANSTISSRADGIYTAKVAIPANTTLDASYFNESVPISGGLTGGIKTELTNLNNKITNVENVTNFFTNSTSYTQNLTMVKNGQVVTIAGNFDNFNDGSVLLGIITKNLPVGNRVYAPAIRNDTSALVGSIYLNTDGRLLFYGSSFNAQLTFSITYITG